MHTNTSGKPLLTLVLLLILTTAATSVSQASKATAEQQRKQQPNAAAPVQAAPVGWVNVGYDYDNDGIFDAYELISVYDLQKSQAHRQPDRRSLGERKGFFEQSSFLEPEPTASDRPGRGALKGRIMALADVGIANSDSRHVLAKINSQQGTIATVDLGPAADLKELNLQKGDVVKVYGVQGNIDQKAILIANSLQTGGKRLQIDRSTVRPMKKFHARILKTRELSQKGKTNLLARVELEDGLTTIVNFGPAAELPQLNEGQKIQFLARITEIEGKKALIADRLRTQGKSYRIDWKKMQKSTDNTEA